MAGADAPRTDCATVQALVESLQLRPHPESGYFRESFRSPEEVTVSRQGQCVQRPASTAIYYLLQPGNASRLHRIASDETWHFYQGDPMTVVVLDEHDGDDIGGSGRAGGGCQVIRLGTNLKQGEHLQFVVPARRWFASFVEKNTSPSSSSSSQYGYSLVGCTVAPGFEFEDFELADGAALLASHPQAAHWIRKLTSVDASASK